MRDLIKRNEAASSSGTRQVILYGPPFGTSIPKGSGGGTGGYTRNMEAYLSALKIPGVEMRALLHTVRGQTGDLREFFLVRFLIDVKRILVDLLIRPPDAVHILGRYRSALPRELILALACRLLKVPLIYDIKAGDFINDYNGGNWARRLMIRFIVNSASAVLAEGEVYRAFLRSRFGIDAIFFPNFVPACEARVPVPERLAGDTLKVLFVGYCNQEKGVVDLVEGCARVARAGQRVELTVIGEEEISFKHYADTFVLPDEMTLERRGRRPHAEVRAAMLENDIFCFPSRHSGEGHSNAVNEAMMSGMVIICTRRGFLESVVGAENGYFMDTGAADEVRRSLTEIAEAADEARMRARRVRAKLLAEFTDETARERLAAAYHKAFGCSIAVETPETAALRGIEFPAPESHASSSAKSLTTGFRHE